MFFLFEHAVKKVALSGEMGKCEMCGKVDLRSKFKKNKRFCSSQCAKGMKAQQQQMQQQPTPPPPSVPLNTTSVNNINDNRTKSKGKKMVRILFFHAVVRKLYAEYSNCNLVTY